ncbi:MAG: transposase [Actinomycetota bacterium]|nr:transposase [Actinomycetota bacterium]
MLSDAIAQIPGTHRRDLLVRCDGAGASHDLLDWLTEQGQVRGRSVDYSVGFAITEKIREALALVPKQVWTPATDADGGIRTGGDVAELTGLLDLSAWPEGMWSSCAANAPTPALSSRCFEKRDGWRYQAFVTNTPTGQVPFLDARHRAHACVEDRIRHAKDTGLGRFPSREFAINQTWLMLTTVAADLTAWTRLLAFTGEAAVLAGSEPKALRYRFLHVPARLAHSGRRRRLRIPETWPWVAAIVAVFANIAAIPEPA